MRSSFFFIFLILSIHHEFQAQSLDRVQGELLIELEEEGNLASLKRDYLVEYGLDFEKVTSIPMHIWKLKFDFTEVDDHLLLKTLSRDTRIKYVQFNHLIEERVIPDDPEFTNQWQYMQSLGANGDNNDLDAELAWDIATGGVTVMGDTIVACIIDDGIDGDHEDFGDNIWINHAEVPDNGIDDDGNGYIDDYTGWDTYNNNSNVFTDGSHGTPVAGIVGAKGNNGIGVTGVNWDVKLMIVRGGGNEANALASYSYPYYFRKLYNETNGDQGAFVVVTNASWGTNYGDPASAPLWCNFYDALGEEGIISCGATANLGINIDQQGDLPTGCSSDYLIAVTNMNQNDQKVNEAGYGIETIDLGAFGANTFTTNGNNGYGGFGGTSGATPHVAGTIALLFAAPCQSFASLAHQDPSLSALLAKQFVLDGVEPNETLTGITTTGGRLNINNAVLGVMANCTACPLATNVEFGNISLDGFDVTWEQSLENETINLRYKSELDADWTVVENSLEVFVQADYGATIELPEVLAADSYSLEYKQVNSDEWLLLDSPNSDNKFLVNGLLDCTRYQFRSQLVCLGELAEYFYFDDYTTSCGTCTDEAYCEIEYADNSLEWIAEVVFNEETVTSAAGPNGYESMIGVQSFTFRKEEFVDLKLTPAFSATIYEEWWKVWIDYDGDGIFNDDIELVYESPELSDTTNVGQFQIPLEAEIGYTRLRIVMNWNKPAFSCGDMELEFGEVEDYCVFIDDQSSISNPRFNKIELFPNPITNTFRLKNVFEPGELEIYTADGQLIKSESLQGKGDYRFNLDDRIDAGVYFVIYKTSKGSWSEKLIKM